MICLDLYLTEAFMACLFFILFSFANLIVHYPIQLRIYIGKELTEKQKETLKKFVTSQCKFTYRHSYLLKGYNRRVTKNELKKTIETFSSKLYKKYKEINTIINL